MVRSNLITKFAPLLLIAALSLLISVISLLVSHDLSQTLMAAFVVWCLPFAWQLWQRARTDQPQAQAHQFFKIAIGRFLFSIGLCIAVLVWVAELRPGLFFGLWFFLLLLGQVVLILKISTPS